MPRPKKPGAPEPKRRSRAGCWPCKNRKIKCDEAKPSCVNCQRQGETCDYSIRLNWDGRGKKKTESGDGMITFGSSRPSSRDSSSSTPTTPAMPVPPRSYTSQPSMIKPEDYRPLPSDGAYSTALPEPSSQYDQPPQIGMRIEDYGQPPPDTAYTGTLPEPSLQYEQQPSMNIDPTLIRPGPQPMSLYEHQDFGSVYGRPDPQHAQSYERYRSLTPGTPGTSLSAQLPPLARLRQTQAPEESLSPTDSGFGSPNTTTFSRSITLQNIDSPGLTPPSYGNGKDDSEIAVNEVSTSDRPLKRIRYHAGLDANSSYDMRMPPPSMTSLTSYNIDAQTSSLIMPAPASSVGTPLTPASSLSDDGYAKPYSAKTSPHATQESPDLRRLSVSSLLSGPPGMAHYSDRPAPRSNPEVQDWSIQYQDVYQDTTTWGIDRGIKDLDIGKNDDMNAITGVSPVAMRDHLELVLDEDGELMPVEFGFGMETNNTAFENGGYYDKPVAISIPKALEPLPSKLLENPMNLLHHFLNHTAGCLIPHNCSSNPFRSILPQMAVQDDNLLNLLLAYSASHRARLLRQPEPATRIALWVQDIFPNLRRALDDPSQIITNSNLATAIMLASLEIISPKAFGVEVPWQKHLDTARQMIAARGGPQRVQSSSRGDKVSSFLWSWFAYLDVLGSLSGGKANSSSSAWIMDYEIDEENDYQIDCILGFTSRCVRILAKIAEMSRICDAERIGADLEILSDWKPSEDTVSRAEKLEADLSESRLHPAKPCTHMQSTGEVAYQWDSLEMAATNEAFHWAGLVHLHRRILGKPSTHPDVQKSVLEIFGALYKVRRGSSAEACLLFPMFTAGCDTEDEKRRSDILERIKGVERVGMTQVHKARTLMERVWETGKPWETLVAGEFFG
ncbi:hypothetical protein N431DRAFT_490664 [Stipitochalara longipes BDJ]|nr:hypothetical protein N431DRAFT_490664 [Stipitochalara longipes BDJ]